MTHTDCGLIFLVSVSVIAAIIIISAKFNIDEDSFYWNGKGTYKPHGEFKGCLGEMLAGLFAAGGIIALMSAALSGCAYLLSAH